MKVPTPKAHLPERRGAVRCPYCNATAITQETTVKNTAATKWWRCSPCGKTWPERRAVSA